MSPNSEQRERIKSRREARKRYWSAHDRDSYQCPGCGAGDVLIEVHHRNGDPFDNRLKNLVGLCHECHVRRHRRRNIDDRLAAMRDAVDELGAGRNAASQTEQNVVLTLKSENAVRTATAR
jgi:5-methylcytosine-specific restriction endonuclease McrA